jgi:nitrate/nitrite-specific signal transduction histidine kinase
MGRALLAALFWSLLGLIFTLSMYAMSGWVKSLLSSLSQWWSWGVMAPLIFAIDRRLHYTARQLARRVIAHLLISPVITAIYIYVFAVARAVLGVKPWSYIQFSKQFAQNELGWFLWSGLIYWMIVGGLQAFRYYDHYLSSELRLERLERRFTEARLNALRMQLDPHFLFNALNTISSHVESDPKLTRTMIEHLGDLLRMSLESKDRQEVPLSEELEFLDHYLAIQKIRFGSKLKIEIDVAPEVRYASVPSLIIQPLVENAIRHGISRRSSGGTVAVSAERRDSRLEIRVRDNGVGLLPGWTLEASAGVGLAVTRDRIAGLYPNGDSRFAVRRREEGGTEVEISLPLHVAEEEANGHAVA